MSIKSWFANVTGAVLVSYDENGEPIQTSNGIDKGLVSIDGTVTVKQETDVSAYQENDRIIITASTTPVPTWDLSWADEFTVSIERTGSTDTVKVEVSLDGENFSPIAPVGRDSLNGNYISCAALADKMVTIPLNAKKVRFIPSGATDSFTIDWSARNAGRGAV